MSSNKNLLWILQIYFCYRSSLGTYLTIYYTFLMTSNVVYYNINWKKYLVFFLLLAKFNINKYRKKTYKIVNRKTVWCVRKMNMKTVDTLNVDIIITLQTMDFLNNNKTVRLYARLCNKHIYCCVFCIMYLYINWLPVAKIKALFIYLILSLASC